MNGIFSLIIPILFLIIFYSLKQTRNEQSQDETNRKKYTMPPIGQNRLPHSMRQMKAESDPEPKPMMRNRETTDEDRFDQSVRYNINQMEQMAESPLIDRNDDDDDANDLNESWKDERITGESIALTRKQIAQGILLSELLGPPRAYKPYSPTKYRK